MKFVDLPLGSLVLYTYNYSDIGIRPEVSEVITSNERTYFCIKTIYSSFSHTTNVNTMDSDDRATLISIVSSVDDAIQHFPELFI